MIKYKTNLTEKEKQEVISALENLSDIYRDFYLTKNNCRLFFKENKELLLDSIKKGDKIVYSEEGLLIVNGFSDNANRKYLKILAKDLSITKNLLNVLLWNLNNIDLYIKIKKNNPIVELLQNQGFVWLGNRGAEVLYIKKSVIKGE